MRLARAVFPELASHKLNVLLRYLSIPRPRDRHRAMPDAELTVAVFARVLTAGAGRRWSTLLDLDAAAGIFPRPSRAGAADVLTQEALF